MTAKAYIHSLDREGRHPDSAIQEVEVLRNNGVNDMVVRTQSGITCTAISNPFCGMIFADDVYGVIEENKGEN